MRTLLEKYAGKEIGVNLIKPLHIETVTLVQVCDEYFTVNRSDEENQYHLPYLNIVKIIENTDGVEVPGIFKQKNTSLPLVVKIGHLVDYIPT